MKSVITFVCALALSFFVVVPAGAAINLLDDPSFEAATSGTTTSNSAWVLNANMPDTTNPSAVFETASFASYPGDPGETGVWFKSFEGEAGGTLANVELSQVVPDVEGGWYHLSFYAKREANFTARQWYAEISSDGTGGTDSVDLLAVAPADGEWYRYWIMIVGVSAMDDVTVRVVMNDGINSQANPQSAFVDNFILIPEPASLAALGFGILAISARRRARR